MLILIFKSGFGLRFWDPILVSGPLLEDEDAEIITATVLRREATEQAAKKTWQHIIYHMHMTCTSRHVPGAPKDEQCWYSWLRGYNAELSGALSFWVAHGGTKRNVQLFHCCSSFSVAKAWTVHCTPGEQFSAWFGWSVPDGRQSL